MKKFLLIALLLTAGAVARAQENLYPHLIDFLTIYQPDFNYKQKVVAVQLWSQDNRTEREANQAFEKAYNTFKVARLKGGREGLVVVLLNRENLNEMAVITLGKDGVTNSFSYKQSDIEAFLDVKDSNLVFDGSGKIIYKNLPPATIFSSIHSLITR